MISLDVKTPLVTAAQEALAPTFNEIDGRVKENLDRVLGAFRQQRLGVHHFSSMTGYGHGDLGREVLDRVFAQVMGAEAALVRVQFVSGTHAIATALFGVLRPGDELVSLAGAPYDTLEEVIGLRGHGQGSLKDFGIHYREIPLLSTGEPGLGGDRHLCPTSNPHGAHSTLLWLYMAAEPQP